MSTAPRPALRASGEVVLLAMVAIAFPVLVALIIALAGIALAVAVGHFALYFVKLLWVLLIPLFAAMRGLWSTPDLTDGEAVTEAEAPELFALIDRLRAESNAARIHGVYLTDSFNASMSQIPRYGIFGGTRNELHLGLPLMTVMDVEHVTAIVAHEIGHLARRHGSFSARVYTMRCTLDVLLIALDRGRSPLVHLVAWFYRAFTPRFERASLTLSRAVELEADSAAAAAVGSHVTAEALLVARCVYAYCDREVWPAIFKRMASEPEPPTDIYGVLAEHFRTPIGSARRFVTTALAARTSETNSHPALIDRLTHLGCDPTAMEFALDRYAVGVRNAADVFLAGAGTQRRILADRWRKAIRAEWIGVHAELQQLAARLRELDALGEATSPAQLRERSLAAARLGRDDAATLLAEASDAFPADVELAMRAGSTLGDRDTERAISYLDRAAAADPVSAIDAWLLSRAYCDRLGEAARTADYDARIAARQAALAAAAAERSEFTGSEPLEAHALDDEALAPIQKALDLADLQAVYLGRRILTHLPEIPQFVLAVVRNRSKYGTSDANIASMVSKDLESYPFGVTVFVTSKRSTRVVAALRAVAGTELRL